MSGSSLPTLWLLLAFVSANVPWLTERVFGVLAYPKSAALRWLEWLLYYAANGLVGYALEKQLTGTVHPQQWEFVVATLCLYGVFALPGFIYHYDLKKLLRA
jgi:hypothetical protein